MLPPDQARGLVRLLKQYEADELVPAEKVHPELADPKRRPGALLEAARLRADLSQDELAASSGIPQPNISAMEAGRRPIGARVAKRLAAVLKIDFRMLLE